MNWRKGMFKVIALTIIMILNLSASSFSQTKGVIMGIVVDDSTRNSLGGANILVLADSTGTSTDDDGNFELHLESGKQHLQISYIGYSSNLLIVDVTAGDTVFVEIELTTETGQAETITIEEKAPEINFVPQKIALDRKLITELVTTTPDVLQSVQKLPGVQSVSDKSAEFNVRGSHFDEHLTMIDDVPVARPFHLKSGSYESISIFNPKMIDEVEFYPGDFPAKYGWKMSSAMNIKYRKGSRDSVKFTSAINTMRTNLVLEGPLDVIGSWIVGVRKSYLDYWFKSIRPFEHSQGDFIDIQSHISFNISEDLWFDINLITGKSDYSYTPDNKKYLMSTPLYTIIKNISGDENRDYKTSIKTLKATYALTPETFISLTGASYKESEKELSIFNSIDSLAGGETVQNFSEGNHDLDYKRIYFRSEIEHEFNQKIVITAGAEYMRNDFDISSESENTIFREENNSSYTTRVAVDQEISQKMYSVYGGLVINPVNNFYLYPGIRLQQNRLSDEMTVNLSTSFTHITPNNKKIYGGLGIYHQPPSYVEFLSKNLTPAGKFRNQKTIQGSLGTSWQNKSGGTFKIEGFYKYSPNILPYIYEDGRYNYEFDKSGKAVSFGFDLSLSGTLSKNVLGTVNYGFLNSKEKIDGDNESWIPRATERPHYLNVGIIHTVSQERDLDFIFNFTVGFGYPYTAKRSFETDESGFVHLIDGKRNACRYKPYRRLDIRWNRTLNNFKLGELTFNGNLYLEIVNIWDVRNAIKYDWEFFGINNVKKVPTFLTPRMYGVGFSLEF